jgi:hypothetical protein
MKERCTNPNRDNYEDYGGRGITFCKRWEDFENFLQDMGERPEGMTLDRLDNSKGYFKGNCKWSTPYEQGCNRSSSKIKPEYVPAIFALYGAGIPQERIGKFFNVHQTQISKILNGVSHASARPNSTD